MRLITMEKRILYAVKTEPMNKTFLTVSRVDQL